MCFASPSWIPRSRLSWPWTDFFLSLGEVFSHFPTNSLKPWRGAPIAPIERKYIYMYSAYLLVKILLSNIALMWNRQSRSSDFSPNPHFFAMLSSMDPLVLQAAQLKCAESPQNPRAFSGPDNGLFNILPSQNKRAGGFFELCSGGCGHEVELVKATWARGGAG